MGKDADGIIKEKLRQVDEIMDKLNKKALEDEKITDDEKSLLKNIENNIKTYIDTINQASKNNIIDADIEKIHVIEKKILQDARAKVFEDGIVSKEEQNLIGELISIFEELSSVDF